MSDAENLDELRNELDEYPLPEDSKSSYPKPGERSKISYKDVDVTITFNKESKTGEEDEARVLFADSGFDFSEMIYDDKSGKLRIPIVLAKEMVYHYDSYDAFRPKDELEAVAAYLKGVPVTRGHPEAKMVTDREEVLGWAVEAEFEDDELRAVLEVTDKELINDIRTKKLQGVSPGHFSRLDKTSSGDYDGEHYDLTQRDIFVDHIAIVERGRCSTDDGCGIMVSTKLDEVKTKEGDETGIMESKVVESKVDAAIAVVEKIEKKAEEEERLLKEIVETEDVPSAVIAKVKKVIGLAGTIGKEAESMLKPKLEDVKSGVAEPKSEASGGSVNAHTHPSSIKVDEAAIKKVETERDALKVELDAIIEAEKVKLVDELGSIQDIKPKEALEQMSLDSLKSDLELVTALRESKFSTDGQGGASDGKEAIKNAYKDVGVKGGKR